MHTKKKLLYLSPFWPMKSGISDYSEILIYGLKDFFDITLLIDNYKLQNDNIKKDFKILRNKHDAINFDEYDHIIYNIGNNPEYHSYMYEHLIKYPGYIILHDYILYYLVIGYYQDKGKLYSKVYEMEGPKGIDIIKRSLKASNNKDLLHNKNIASLFPLNNEIIENSEGIIIHSEYTKKLIENRIDKTNILKINMVSMNETDNYKVDLGYLRKKYNINDEDFVIGSFGYIAPTKQNHLICETVKKMNADQDRKIYYVMVGEGDYIDKYLDKHNIKTGFVNQEIYNSILSRVDIVSNLRYPSMGETSISLIHAMGMGKACLVTDDAWFSELPNESVIKIKQDITIDQMIDTMQFLSKDTNKLKTTISTFAKNFIIKEHNLSKISTDIYKFINKKDGVNLKT